MKEDPRKHARSLKITTFRLAAMQLAEEHDMTTSQLLVALTGMSNSILDSQLRNDDADLDTASLPPFHGYEGQK